MSDPWGNVDPGKKKIRENKYNAAIGDVSRKEKNQATGKKGNDGMHGQYKQANFKLLPERIDEINEWADRLNVNKSQLKRYIAWRGLQALRDGERPEKTGSVERLDELVEY